MFNGLSSVLIVFIILAVGFFFTWKKRWPDNTTKIFSITVVNIAAPALAITSIAERFTPQLLRASGLNLLLILACVLLMYLLGGVLAKALSLSRKKTAVFQVMFAFNNTIFIGLPINLIVFGGDGLPYLFTYYLVTITLFWSLGAYTLARASETLNEKGFSWKKIFSPGLIGVIIGCIIVETQVDIPMIINSALTYLGNLCVPLSLLVIGSNLAVSAKKGFTRITGDEALVMVAKFLISPMIMLLLLSVCGVSGMAKNVIVFTAAMPCHAQTAILSEYYDVEPEYASKLVSLSTLLCLIVIPIYAAWLT